METAVVVRTEKSMDTQGISTMIIGPCRTMADAMEFCRRRTKRDKMFFICSYPNLTEESGEDYYSLNLGDGYYLRYETRILFPTNWV